MIVLKIFLMMICMTLFVSAESLIQPLEPIKNIDHKKAELGKLLFFDPILSRDKSINCASCHKAEYGWADNKVVSVGVYNRKGIINSPTVVNAVYNFKQFWNGRADTLKEQAKGPIHTAFEMDMDNKTLEERLNKSSLYVQYFKKIYKKERVEFDDVIDAIAEYEKRLTTKDSKFDRYLKGKATLTKEEERGYTIFKTYGCITCHNGQNIGGNSFQKIGIVISYDDCYLDRYEITKREFDKCVYKVPSLRNISKTAPYFHDGSAKTLQDAIKVMAYHNLGFKPRQDDVESLEAFLKTFDADLREER